MPSAGQTGGSNESLGVIFHSAQTAATTSAPVAGMRWDTDANDRAYWEQNAAALVDAIATTNIARDVWHKLRVLESNGTFIIYVDAAQIGATTLGLTSGQYVGFVTQWSLKVDFRNLKGWRIPLPAQPA